MKKHKKLLYILSAIAIVLLILTIVYVVFIKKNCTCKETKTNIVNLGMVSKTEEVNATELKSFYLIISGEKNHTIKNDELNKVKLYNYNITTSIDKKSDVSTWLGFKIEDVAKIYGETIGKTITASTSQLVETKTYSSSKNLYVFLKKNNEDIVLNNINMAVLADVSKDSSNWLYNPVIINLK